MSFMAGFCESDNQSNQSNIIIMFWRCWYCSCSLCYILTFVSVSVTIQKVQTGVILLRKQVYCINIIQYTCMVLWQYSGKGNTCLVRDPALSTSQGNKCIELEISKFKMMESYCVNLYWRIIRALKCILENY